jgi:hypothetical protein
MFTTSILFGFALSMLIESLSHPQDKRKADWNGHLGSTKDPDRFLIKRAN